MSSLAEPDIPEGARITPRAVRFTLIALLVVYVINFVDRQIVNILAESIKNDLNLSDTSIGLLTGMSFAVAYTVLGLPIARLVDRPTSNRVTIISGSLAIWAGSTSLFAFAQNFGQMILLRLGVAAGEAGYVPAAHSMIGNLVPPERRPGAIAVFGLGMPIGMLLGLMAGGWLETYWGWRHAFLFAGVPGLLIAPLLYFFLKDSRSFTPPAKVEAAMPLRSVFQEMLKSKAMVHLMFGSVAINFVGYGIGVWTPIYFIRVHHLDAATVGLALGLCAGIGGILGTWLGGVMATRFGADNPRHILTAPSLALAIATPFAVAGYLLDDWRIGIACLFVPYVANPMGYGPVFATVQSLMPPGARATAVSVKLMLQTLLGLGLGPLMIGVASDALQPTFGILSLRYVLIAISLVALLPFLSYWMARKHLKEELYHLRAH